MILFQIILFKFAFGMSRKPIELPEKPTVTFCFININTNNLDCVLDKILSSIPIYNADKFVCFNPDDWKEIARYNLEIRNIARRCER